jgi:hypothetical protein
MSNPADTVTQLRMLGLVPLGDGDSVGVTLARDEGRHSAFRVRVYVPNDGQPRLRINGKPSDERDVVAAVRHFLKVVHPTW